MESTHHGYRTPLQRERKLRSWKQQQVIDAIKRLAHEQGYGHSLDGLEVNALSRLENGRIQRPRDPLPELFAELYGKPAEILFPASAELIELRTLDRSSATDVDVEAWELTQALESSNVGGQTLERLELQAIHLGQQLPLMRPDDLLPQVRRQLRPVVDLLHRPQPVAQRRRLAAIAGQLAGLGGVLHSDLWKPAHADDYYVAGLLASEESGDEALNAYLLGNRSIVFMFGGNPRRGVELLEQAQHHALKVGRPTPQLAWLATLEAEARALTGDPAECHAALKRATRTLERADQAARRPGIDFFSEARLAAQMASCKVILKEPARALPAAEEALTLLDRSHSKSRAFILLDRASAHVGLGDVDAACADALEALTIVEASRMARLNRRASRFYAELAPFGASREVRTFKERFRQAVGGEG
jgi:transcriptional regulator with XRE-family HTH domain